MTAGLIFCAKDSATGNLWARAEKVNKSNTVFQALEFSIDIEAEVIRARASAQSVT